MKRLAIILIATLVLAAAGCIDFGTQTRRESGRKPAVEELKVPPKPIRKQDVDANNPQAAIDGLQRELDWDQNQGGVSKDQKSEVHK